MTENIKHWHPAGFDVAGLRLRMTDEKPDYVCYVPMPRCASTSIKGAMQNAGVLDKYFFHDIPGKNGLIIARPALEWVDMLRNRWWQNFKVKQTEVFKKAEKHDCKLFLWTVVRNPYDRIVSCWKLALKETWVPDDTTLKDFISIVACLRNGFFILDSGGKPTLNAGPESAGAEFSMSVDSLSSVFVHTVSIVETPLYLTDFARYPKERPKDYAAGISGNLINITVNGSDHGVVPLVPNKYRIPMPFYIVRFENLQSDFDTLCEYLGWPKADLPHFNKIKSDDFMSYHTIETIQLTNMLYEFEFDYFYRLEKVTC